MKLRIFVTCQFGAGSYETTQIDALVEDVVTFRWPKLGFLSLTIAGKSRDFSDVVDFKMERAL